MNLGDFRELTKSFGDESTVFVEVRVDGRRVSTELKSIEVEPSALVGAQIITLNG